MRPANPFPDTAYWRRYQARSTGLLHWPAVDALWPRLAASTGPWYVYDLQSLPPATPLTAAGFAAFLPIAEALVNTRRDRSHSGAIYIDTPANPAFVKIFDPANMGTSCGGDHDLILPRYILSHHLPDPKPASAAPKKGFLGRLVLAGRKT